MKKYYIVTMTMTLLLCGCTNVQPISSVDNSENEMAMDSSREDALPDNTYDEESPVESIHETNEDNVDKQAITKYYEKIGGDLGEYLYIWDSPKYDIPLLLVTDYSVSGEDAELFGLGSAYDCIVYYLDIQNNQLSKMGEIMSYSTAYPIAATDEGLFCAGNHSVYEYVPDFKIGKLVLWYGFEDNTVNIVGEHSGELEITKGEMKDVAEIDADIAYDAYHSAKVLSFAPLSLKRGIP